MLLFAIAQRFKFGCGFTRHLFHQGSPLEAALLPRKLSPSAVGIYPVTDEATESKLVCPSRKQRRRCPQAANRAAIYAKHKLRHEYNLLTG
jgi:hypothetical protein